MAFHGYGERDSRGGRASDRDHAGREQDRQPARGGAGAAGANLGDQEDASLLGAQGIRVPVFLFGLLGGMFAWTVHFALSYFLVALSCSSGWGGAEAAIWGVTALFAGVAAAAGWVSWRAWRRVAPDQPWDGALSEPRGWQGFLAMTGILLAATALLAIVTEALALPWLHLCRP